KIIYKSIIFTLITCILLLPLNIGFITSKKIIVEKKTPIQIIFDVSLSMASNDILPSRFISAKNSLLKLLDKLNGYNISIITFSGLPLVYIPFSSDTNGIIKKFEKTNLGDFPPVSDFLGTAIGDALLLAINNLNKINRNNTEKNGIIILLTDGDSNKGYDPMQVLPLIKNKVSIFTLGVGQNNYIIGQDKWNDSIYTNINTQLLEDIANKTNGAFYRILETKNFDEFFDNIGNIIKQKEKQKIENQYLYLNDYLLYLILFCLLSLIIIKAKKPKSNES
ncbi:MAG: VWA domain-containing protein, partial [Candidatus Absconditabacterales bacterium]